MDLIGNCRRLCLLGGAVTAGAVLDRIGFETVEFRFRDNCQRIVRERANLCLADGAGEACGEECGERPAGEGEEHTDPANGLAADGGGDVAC